MTPVLRRCRYPQRIRLYNRLISALACALVIAACLFVVVIVGNACCGW